MHVDQDACASCCCLVPLAHTDVVVAAAAAAAAAAVCLIINKPNPTHLVVAGRAVVCFQRVAAAAPAHCCRCPHADTVEQVIWLHLA